MSNGHTRRSPTQPSSTSRVQQGKKPLAARKKIDGVPHISLPLIPFHESEGVLGAGGDAYKFINQSWIRAQKRYRESTLLPRTTARPPHLSFQQTQPTVTVCLEMSSVYKRTRSIVKPESVTGDLHWNVVSTKYDELSQSITLPKPINCSLVVKTMEVFSELAGDELPSALDVTTHMLKESKDGEVSTLYLSKEHYAIMQALGFALNFEMTDIAVGKGTSMRTIPLAPLLYRFYVIATGSDVVDKWYLYASSYVLTSWLSRRFFDYQTNTRALMLSPHGQYFSSHYALLPDVLGVMKIHLDKRDQTLDYFFSNTVVGIGLIYSFLAPTQIDRISHRVIVEGMTLRAKTATDEVFCKRHTGFFAAVAQLYIMTKERETPDRNLIIVPKDDETWTQLVLLLHQTTFKIACDPIVPTDIAVVLMLSLLPSALDNGDAIIYIEGINTERQFHQREEMIINELMVSRHPSERKTVAAEFREDLAWTSMYDARIFYDVSSVFTRKLCLVRRHNGTLGNHAITTKEEYKELTLRQDSLFARTAALYTFDHGHTSLYYFLAHIDDYYTTIDLPMAALLACHEIAACVNYLLPIDNESRVFEQLFFHLVNV